MNMNRLLGLVFLMTGFVSFYEGYGVLREGSTNVQRDRNALSEDRTQDHHSYEQTPQRTPARNPEKLLKATWWILGGVSSVALGLLLLVLQS